ncbi:hypothetical protein [Nocardioides sp. GXZ039]|uniref:hypothetical protein n=1 Tax=Nocardioides sp. GXZ039 TaxID=3136018 RepID=UPI0030F47D93
MLSIVSGGCLPFEQEAESVIVSNEWDEELEVTAGTVTIRVPAGEIGWLARSGCRVSTLEAYTINPDSDELLAGDLIAAYEAEVCPDDKWTVYGPGNSELN